jgi:hypothetical protein
VSDNVEKRFETDIYIYTHYIYMLTGLLEEFMLDSLTRFKIIVYYTMGCVILEKMCQQVRPLEVY